MRIQMVTLMAGPDGVLQPGQIADLPTAQAKALIDGGFARPAKAAADAAKSAAQPAAPIETETIEPAETAVQPKAEPKGKGKG